MDRCNTCGGSTLFLGNDKYLCLYCGNEYNVRNSTPVCVSKASTTVNGVKKMDNGVDVFETNIDGVLEIEWSDDQYRHSGSGFLISKDGYALTNTHVVTHEDGKSCGEVNVRIKGQQVKASVVKLGDNQHGSGNGIDLALIKLDRLPKNAKTLTFENFDNVRIGERVFVIGNSLGYGTCITSGIVSDKCREVDGQMLLMTDCAVNGGNSGGPIFNDKGKVIGVIVSGITEAEGMNFAIPSKDAMRFISNKVSLVKKYDYADNGKSVNINCPKCGRKMKYENGWAVCDDCDTQKRLYCPHCSRDNISVLNSGNLWCDLCGKEISPSFLSSKKPTKYATPAKAPCPECNSWNTNVENGIFYCEDCGFEGG